MRSARIESAADALVDWVSAEIVDYQLNLDERGLAVIRQLVARAMITQHDYDEAVRKGGVGPTGNGGVVTAFDYPLWRQSMQRQGRRKMREAFAERGPEAGRDIGWGFDLLLQ